MRIISGTHKGRKIVAPKNLPVRPTTDFAKEGLFNVLQNELEFKNLTVLDLFCGTGNISYEFASRGAQKISSVDQNGKCIAFVMKTATEFNFNITPIRSSAAAFLKHCKTQYNLIFADPPYAMEEQEQLLNTIFDKQLLAIDGLFILEHALQKSFENNDHFIECRSYGNVNFSFFR